MEEKRRVSIAFVGAAKSGKSALIRQFIGYPFEADYRKTIGIDYYAKHSTDSQDYAVSLWDISGAEDYLALTRDMIDRMLLCEPTLETIVIVLDGSQDDDVLASQLNQWLDVVLKSPRPVPTYVFINKLDLLEAVDRPDRIFAIRETISRVLRERELTQDVMNARGFSVYVCSAKTGEGVSAAFDALFENSQHNVSILDDVVDETPVPELKVLDAKPTPPFFWLTFFSRGIKRGYHNIKGLFVHDKRWMGGNLLIVTAILAMITVTLLLSVGGVFMPAWGFTLLLGSALFALWNIGCVYQARRSKRIPAYPALERDSLLLGEEEENKRPSWERGEPLSFSLLGTPPNRSPLASDDETADHKPSQNVRNPPYFTSEYPQSLLGDNVEEEEEINPWERGEPFSLPSNYSSTTSDDEASYEKTSDDETCQNAFPSL